MANRFFSEEKVSEIRDRSSILEVISDYVTLKKTGKHYKGLCPFHSEKTPSFMVNEEKQIFHCFGCGAGGDVFKFLMEIGHFSFPQALEELAKRYGIKLPSQELTPAQKREMAKRDILFQINQTASEYFHDLLVRRKEGEEGRKYLSRRGVSQNVVEEYRLGYSTERWDGLVQYLREKKIPLDLAGELGLVFPKKRGGGSNLREGWYDAFRGRILFPVFDLHQRVVGFGGRKIGEGQPKYLNSPESIIYHKGDILYGLQVAKGYVAEKDCVILVEGYFDLLALHQHGLHHSVATLGTALTPQHIRTLKRYTKNLITVFDPDSAGIQATLRSIPLFLGEEVEGKTITLPGGEDPDEFLRKRSAEDFEKRIVEAVPLIDFYMDRLMKTYDVKSIEGRIKVAEEGLALIGKVPQKIRQDLYVNSLADRLDLQASLLYEMLQLSRRERVKVEEDLKKRSTEKSFPKSEEMILRLMVHYPAMIRTISQEGILKEFESPVLQRMALELESVYQKKGGLDLTEALGSLEEDLRQKLYEFAFEGGSLEGGDQEKMLKDCIQTIRAKRKKREGGELFRKIKDAENQKEGKELEAHLAARQALEKGWRSLAK